MNINTAAIQLNEIGASENGSGEEKSAKTVAIMSTDYDIQHEFFIIYTGAALLKGKVYELYMPFEADLNQALSGYYRSSYLDGKEQKRM